MTWPDAFESIVATLGLVFVISVMITKRWPWERPRLRGPRE